MSVRGRRRARSSRAVSNYAVRRVRRMLRESTHAGHVSSGVPVYLAAILECLTKELLERAANVALNNRDTSIDLRHLQLAARHDQELNALLAGVTISQDGVLPTEEQP
ncbi:unnamed protein product [Thelazia callipaeda]|uniref:Histone H2A n=1 Tax=Thelazia callipaeda TaxID=103827 RepID=A0A0N5CS02_THECL|nr:unnamed protein product [Thelazia callipaeda]